MLTRVLFLLFLKWNYMYKNFILSISNYSVFVKETTNKSNNHNKKATYNEQPLGYTIHTVGEEKPPK